MILIRSLLTIYLKNYFTLRISLSIFFIYFKKILVMDAGRVVEYESPWRLLQSPDSFLSILVRQTGPEMAAVLIAMARKASDDDPSAPTAQDIQQSYTTADDQKTERSSTSSRSVERSDIVGIPGYFKYLIIFEIYFI